MRLWPIGKHPAANTLPELTIFSRVSERSGRNEYLLMCEGQAALIDVADGLDEMAALLTENECTLRYVFVTHGHPSRLQPIAEIRKRFDAPFCLHSHEGELLNAFDPALEPDIVLRDNTRLPLGGHQIRVLHTPGHTKGSVCFYLKEARALFSGSTLLAGKHGRIWNGHSMEQMLFSLKRLNYTVSSKATVYPGRGETTSLAKEPWINCLRSA